MPNTLILGGIRSGKSRLAEERVSHIQAGQSASVVYVATGEAGDEEMARRIRQHQARRPRDWGLVEAPVELAAVLGAHAAPNSLLLIDCMSLWLSNLLHAGDDVFARERAAFLESLSGFPGQVVVVSNEVGLGIIGMEALTRRYCDELGRLNQDLAACCDTVMMSVAGLPLVLKQPEAGSA